MHNLKSILDVTIEKCHQVLWFHPLVLLQASCVAQTELQRRARLRPHFVNPELHVIQKIYMDVRRTPIDKRKCSSSRCTNYRIPFLDEYYLTLQSATAKIVIEQAVKQSKMDFAKQ